MVDSLLLGVKSPKENLKSDISERVGPVSLCMPEMSQPVTADAEAKENYEDDQFNAESNPSTFRENNEVDDPADFEEHQMPDQVPIYSAVSSNLFKNTKRLSSQTTTNAAMVGVPPPYSNSMPATNVVKSSSKGHLRQPSEIQL